MKIRDAVYMLLCALCIVFAIAFPALAEEEPLQAPISCNSSICIADKQFIKDMIDAHNAQLEEIRKLEEKVKSPKCATVEVVPDKRPPVVIPNGPRNNS